MTYKNHVNPWCIVRQLPNQQSRLIVRFHRRGDAESHLQILRSKNPTASYEVIFDVTSAQPHLLAQQV
ncbi:hypothetical protein H6F96_29805 [Microcoleus sp. FACHB-53]|nr:hypothetical protein [Microcoleus sp. FACHB-53]